MKIIQVTEHSLTSGSGKKTVINLDQRPGIFFRVVCGTYETPFFTKEQTDIPVMMVRGENSQANVSITCDSKTITIEQGYMQASFVYLFLCANNDWADTCELRTITVDSLDIIQAILSNGNKVDLNAAISGTSVKLTTSGYKPTANSIHCQAIKTSDNKTYICPFTLTGHNYSDNPPSYDYATAIVSRVLTVYEKSGEN